MGLCSPGISHQRFCAAAHRRTYHWRSQRPGRKCAQSAQRDIHRACRTFGECGSGGRNGPGHAGDGQSADASPHAAGYAIEPHDQFLLDQRMDFRLATRRSVSLGQICAGLFMLAGAALNIQGLMLIGFFIFIAAQMEERTVMFQTVVEAVQMEDIMLTEFSILSPADTLEDALNKAVHCLQDDFPVVSGGDLVGVITRQTIVDRLRAEGNGYVQGAMSKAFEIASRTESLGSAFRKLTSRGLSLIPVVDQERLVGIVTLQHLMHSMGLLAESRRLRRQMEERL